MTEGPQDRAKHQMKATGTERLRVGLCNGQTIFTQGATMTLEERGLIEGKGMPARVVVWAAINWNFVRTHWGPAKWQAVNE